MQQKPPPLNHASISILKNRTEGDGASVKSLPCERVPLVVWRARRVNALVASPHVEAHPVCSTLDVLLQTLVDICKYSRRNRVRGLMAAAVAVGGGSTGGRACLGGFARTLTSLAVGHEAVPGGTEAPVAPWCVHALVLTGVPHLALIDVWWRRTQERPGRRITQKTLENTYTAFFFPMALTVRHKFLD